MKGLVLNATLYSQLYSRPCKDIDLWVDITYLPAAMQVLTQMGYLKQFPGYELEGYKKDYYLSHRHDILFYHPQREICVELHFRLESPGINFFKFSPDLLHTVTLGETQVSTLKDNYHLLYLMLHGAIHAYSRLRWLNDIALYLKSNKCDLNKILCLATDIQATHIVLFSLMLVKDIFGTTDEEINIILGKADRKTVYLCNYCKQFICADYELTDGIGSNFGMFLKYRGYLFNLAGKGQKINATGADLLNIGCYAAT